MGAMEQGPWVMMYFLEPHKQMQAPVVMQDELWSELPPDLVERVLIFTSAMTQARWRLVCKRWDSLLGSSGFRDESIRTAFTSRPGSSCIVTLDIQDPEYGSPKFKAITDSLHNVRVDLGFLPPQFRSWRSLKKGSTLFGDCGAAINVSGRKERPYLFGDDGLVLIHDLSEWCRAEVSLCVVNLANKTWTQVPPFRMPRRLHWITPCNTGVAGEGEKGFQVWMLVKSRKKWNFFRYSSRAGAWTSFDIHLPVFLDYLPPAFAVYNDTGLHLLCTETFSAIHRVLPLMPSSTSYESRLLTLDGESGSLVQMEFLPVALNRHLLEYGGRLLWFESTWSPVDRWRMSIWALPADRRNFNKRKGVRKEQVSVIPAQFVPHDVMLPGSSVSILCAHLANDAIFIILEFRLPKQPGSLSSRRRVLTTHLQYKILKGTWEKLECPLPNFAPTSPVIMSRPALYL